MIELYLVLVWMFKVMILCIAITMNCSKKTAYIIIPLIVVSELLFLILLIEYLKTFMVIRITMETS